MRSITILRQLLVWVVKYHVPGVVPLSFFKYKAYFPYFWAWCRNGLRAFDSSVKKEKHFFVRLTLVGSGTAGTPEASVTCTLVPLATAAKPKS